MNKQNRAVQNNRDARTTTTNFCNKNNVNTEKDIYMADIPKPTINKHTLTGAGECQSAVKINTLCACHEQKRVLKYVNSMISFAYLITPVWGLYYWCLLSLKINNDNHHIYSLTGNIHQYNRSRDNGKWRCLPKRNGVNIIFLDYYLNISGGAKAGIKYGLPSPLPTIHLSGKSSKAPFK